MTLCLHAAPSQTIAPPRCTLVLIHPLTQEKVAGSHSACLTRASGTATSTGMHTSRAAGFHLKSKRPGRPWPCSLDAFMPVHHGHLPSTPSRTHYCRVGNTIGFTKQVSHLWPPCDYHHTGVSCLGTATCLWDFTWLQLCHRSLALSTVFFRQDQYLGVWIPFCSYASAIAP